MLQTRLILTKMEAGDGGFLSFFPFSLNKKQHINQNCHNHFFNLQDQGGLAIASNAPFSHS
jgi:hypothetical protein